MKDNVIEKQTIPLEIQELESNRNYNIESFIKAVDLLNSNQTEYTSVANNYINRFGKSQEAFDVSIQVLSSPNLGEKVYYSALTIFRSKLKFNFGNYCNDEVKLKTVFIIIVNAIEKFKPHEKTYILDSLCECLALLFIFAFKTLTTLFEDIIKYYYTLDQEKNIFILVTWFVYLGELTQKSSIVIDKEQFKEFVVFLKSVTDEIFLILTNIVAAGKFSSSVCKNILKTVLAWLDLGLTETTIENLQTSNSILLNFIFNINEENLKAHKHTICLLICERKNPNFTNLVIEKVMQMKSLVGTAIQQKNPEAIVFFLDIFEALCAENIELILSMSNKEFLMIYLELTKVCDEDRIMYVCDFWTEVIRHILRTEKVNKDEEYLKIINGAIRSLISKAKWNSDIFELLNKSNYSDLKDDEDFNKQENFRFSIKEFLTNVSNTISFKEMYNMYFQKEIVNIIGVLKSDFGNMKNWSIFEALIFCVSCVAKKANLADSNLLEEILLTVMEVPIDLIEINRTVTNFIDVVSDILNLLPEVLKTCFQYLVKGLDNPLTKGKILI